MGLFARLRRRLRWTWRSLRHPIRTLRGWRFRYRIWRHGGWRMYVVTLQPGQTFVAPETFLVRRWRAAGAFGTTVRVALDGRDILETYVWPTPRHPDLIPFGIPLMVARGNVLAAGGDDGTRIALAGEMRIPSGREIRERRRAAA